MLARSARRLRVATWIALIVSIVIALYAAGTGLGLVGGPDAVRVTDGGQPLGRTSSMVAAISLLPFAAGLLRLIRMLRRIERGEVFTSGTIADLRGFTLLILISALLSILLPPALAIANALGGGPRRIELVFDSGDFFALLVSALLFLVARLFGEAQRLADDVSQIV